MVIFILAMTRSNCRERHRTRYRDGQLGITSVELSVSLFVVDIPHTVFTSPSTPGFISFLNSISTLLLIGRVSQDTNKNTPFYGAFKGCELFVSKLCSKFRVVSGRELIIIFTGLCECPLAIQRSRCGGTRQNYTVRRFF